MQIIVKKNKKLAFERFLNSIKFQKAYPSHLEDFDILKSLIEDAAKLINLKPKNFNLKQQKIYKEIITQFGKFWKKYQEDLNLIFWVLKSVKKEVWIWLEKQIKLETKIEWPYSKIYLFPGIRNWGAIRKNKICIGVKPSILLERTDNSELWHLIIHELIHANIDKKEFKEIKYKIDAEEIAITLLTRNITKKLKKKFGFEISNQKLATPFRHLEKYEDNFKKIFIYSKSFEELIKKIDIFLKSINHKEYYE